MPDTADCFEMTLTDHRPAMEVLFEARRRIGIRNDELRAQSGVAINSAQYWLAGRATPTMGKLVSFANALGFDIVLRRQSPSPTESPREVSIRHHRAVMRAMFFERRIRGISVIEAEFRSGVSVNASYAWKDGVYPQFPNFIAFVGALGFEVVLKKGKQDDGRS